MVLGHYVGASGLFVIAVFYLCLLGACGCCARIGVAQVFGSVLTCLPPLRPIPAHADQ
jgi:hypothetical protein